MDDDAKLAAFFAASEPPVRDIVFSAEVMSRVARARLMGDVIRLALLSVVCGVVMWACWPSLQPVLSQFGMGLSQAGWALVAATAVIVFSQERAWSMLGIRT